MAVLTVTLVRGSWMYDPDSQLGTRGGFGSVFEGQGPGGHPVAVKRLHVGPQEAAREMRLADEFAGRDFTNVMPTLDAGLDRESQAYFIVMPLADHSLEAEIGARGPLTEPEARKILGQIAGGLLEVPELVHRDLKPDNVLWHGGNWRIADFGIAKFVEEATSTNTLRDFLSAPYAAPEQWIGESATHATDVYALGCIAHFLLTGSPPFPGPDYRRQHLEELPPRVPSSPQLRILLSSMLRKDPAGRAESSGVKEQLEQELDVAGGGALDRLAEVGAQLAEEEAEEARAAQLRADRGNMRQRRARIALEELRHLMDEMLDQAAGAVSNATRGTYDLRLGHGYLRWLTQHTFIDEGSFPNSGWDVIAGATLGVAQNVGEYRGRGTMLWYTDLGSGGDHRWFEVPYMRTSASRARNVDDSISPFAVPDFYDADLAASGVMHVYQLAANPAAIDGDGFAAFIGRWLGYLAKAATDTLQRPDRLPEDRE